MNCLLDKDPKHQLAETMSRLYRRSLTTTSGGNLSIRNEDGTVWITPGGVDKANLKAEDIIRIGANGEVTGKHDPSIETAFHRAIYNSRADVGAVVHAHAPATSSFCVSRSAPDTRIVPQIYIECGQAVSSGYAIPGSSLLTEKLSTQTAKGFHAVLLDNHGTVTVGKNMLHAFQRFEALDVCARTVINAKCIGTPSVADEGAQKLLGERIKRRYKPLRIDNEYIKERKALCEMARRAYIRGLMTSSLGSLSLRTGKNEFLITPSGYDRCCLAPSDIVLVQGDRAEADKIPDLWTELHASIYNQHSCFTSVMTAVPPSAMAYAVTGQPYNSRTLTEGYVLLRDIHRIDLFETLKNPSAHAKEIHENAPVQLVSHGGLIAAGSTMLQVLDRIEVAEVSMRSSLWSEQLGGMQPLNDQEINEIKQTFGLE